MRAEIVFTFPDTRNAIAGEKALLDAGVAVRVMSRPAALGQGCGICLRVDTEAAGDARAVFSEKGIAVEAAFVKSVVGGKSVYAPV